MRVEFVKQAEHWDNYVTSVAPQPSYHSWSWRTIIEETFGHEPYYLAAIEDGRICGVLPLFLIRSRLFGNSLVSLPFFTYAGLLSSSEAATSLLLNTAQGLADQLGARSVEIRQGSAAPIPWIESSPRVTMELVLPTSAEEYWKKLSSGMRNKIRQGQKAGFEIRWGGIQLARAFYEVFAINMRNLGTPVYPFRFFENQLRRMSDRITILTLWEGERVVAGSFLTAHGRTLELPWSASLLESRKKYSQVMMYWLFIQHAISQGFERIDLGRCQRDSGTYNFKRHWNPVERPLYWYYRTKDGASAPNLHADNPKFKIATKVWRHLPLTVTNSLGPRLVRVLP